jgi:2-haloacid dehalogenase
MLNFSNFEVLTFDCYGTLIDWETGIFTALKPVLAAHGKSIADDQLLELYGEFESQAEAGEYRRYREVLRSVVRAFGKRLAFTPTVEEVDSLSNSVTKWRPWPDTVRALKKLSTRYRLAIISNIDDALFHATRQYLPVEFDSVTTAEQAACYKPALDIFKMALNKGGVSPARILHVGQSIYHDVLPAQSLGLATVWVNRPSPRTGVGAVKPAQGKPDLEVPDLESLAKIAVS